MDLYDANSISKNLKQNIQSSYPNYTEIKRPDLNPKKLLRITKFQITSPQMDEGYSNPPKILAIFIHDNNFNYEDAAKSNCHLINQLTNDIESIT